MQEFIAQPGVFDIEIDAIRILDAGGLIFGPASEFDGNSGVVVRVRDAHAAHFNVLRQRSSTRRGAAGRRIWGPQGGLVLRLSGWRALLYPGRRANRKYGRQEDGYAEVS